MNFLIQQIFNGLALGSIYALVAFGFVLIFKATKVFNLAQGEMMMLSAYLAYSLFTKYQLPFIAVLCITLLLSALIGIFTERIVMRPLIGYPIFPIIVATLGLSIILKSIVSIIWGVWPLRSPSPFQKKAYVLFNITLLPSSFWLIILSLGLVVLLYIFFKFTRIGTALRAITDDIPASYLCGINVKRLFNFSWALSLMVGGIAGVFITPITYLHPNLGFLGLKALPAAVIGGFGNFPGAIVGGILLGILETLAGGYLPKGFKEIFPWLVMFLILIIKPEGIFEIYRKKKV